MPTVSVVTIVFSVVISIQSVLTSVVVVMRVVRVPFGMFSVVSLISVRGGGRVGWGGRSGVDEGRGRSAWVSVLRSE
jgi:hypothetical protein